MTMEKDPAEIRAELEIRCPVEGCDSVIVFKGKMMMRMGGRPIISFHCENHPTVIK